MPPRRWRSPKTTFTDVVMPGAMNDRELADAIQSDRPDLKVLYTSSYSENAIIHHGRLNSGVMLLATPIANPISPG